MVIAKIIHPLFLFVSFGIFSFVQTQNTDGFSVELIHRDSPNSPFYNYSESSSQRLANSLRSSIKRATQLFQTSSISTQPPEADVIQDRFEYLMKISIGTPPYEIFAMPDTSSDITWTQCVPCKNCYKMRRPLFDPKRSTSYKNLPCDSRPCKTLDNTECSEDNKTCIYLARYPDTPIALDYSKGNLAVDTFTLPSTTGPPVALPDTVFGCAHEAANFYQNTSGVIGLGGGTHSLLSQMDPLANGKFSYCLLPPSQRGHSTKLNFGDKAVVSGPGVVSTPLVKKRQKTNYFVTLEAMSVGNQTIKYDSDYGNGSVIIDTISTITLFPEIFYRPFEKAVIKRIKHKRVDDPDESYGLPLCYKADGKFNAPVITAHFTGGADVPLQPENTFVQTSPGIWCFSIVSLPIEIELPLNVEGLIGNIAQANFLVGYDLKANKLSFKPTDCAKQ